MAGVPATRDRARTNIGDYFCNRYSSVTPWWVPGLGPKILRLESPTLPADRGANRIARLDSDLEAHRAQWTMTIDGTPFNVSAAKRAAEPSLVPPDSTM